MTGVIRGARIHRHGDLEELVVDELPAPDPGPGEVRVRLRAAALNHLDLWVIGGLPGIDIPLPHVIGADGAGVIDALGTGVEGWSVDDEVVLNPGLWCGRCASCMAGEQHLCRGYRILGEHLDGTAAEAVIVPAMSCHPRPPGLSWHQCAAFPLVSLTAWRMLVSNAGLKPGHTVLVHGIGGGVSLISMQIALAAGATVFVTSHSAEKRARALELGAAEAWDYGEVDIARQAWHATDKRGVDIVVDNVGAATFVSSIESVRRGGTIVTCGTTSGPHLEIDGRRIFWKQIRIIGSTMGNADEFRAVLGVVASGKVAPVVDSVYPLEDTMDALRRLQSAQQFGKVVIDIS